MKRFLHDLSLACRATGVLVATLVGAGYATGREISQYFGAASWATVALAAVLIALFSMAFLYVGAATDPSRSRWMRVYQWVLSVLSVVSCGVMVSAGRSLLGGAWTAVMLCVAGVFLCLTDKLFHVSGVCAVPILLGLVALVCLRAPNVAAGAAFLPVSAANYAGMNLLFEGELLRHEGRGMSGRAILLSGVGIALCMGLLLSAMHRVVGASSAELPFAEVAGVLGLRHVAQGVILISVLSSIAGGMRVTLEVWRTRAPLSVAALLALLFALVVAVVPFADLVRYVYPVMGWAGVAVVAAYTFVALRVGVGRLCSRRKEGKKAYFPFRKAAIFRKNKKSMLKNPIDTLT